MPCSNAANHVYVYLTTQTYVLRVDPTDTRASVGRLTTQVKPTLRGSNTKKTPLLL